MRRFGGRPFVVLWLATFLFYLGFQVLLPVMPIYAASLGARDGDVGLIIGVFAFAAMLLRPLAGALADRLGRRPLILTGAAIFGVASLAYSLASSVPALLGLRVFHGVGMGLGPTAATVMVTDLSPAERRGAAMGVFGLATAVGLAGGPYLGIELVRRAGFRSTFLLAALLEALALALAWTLPETRPVAAAPRLGGAGVPAAAPPPGGLARWFSAGAAYPSLLLLSLYFSFGGLVSFLPLFARDRALGNPGLFFTVFALAGVAVRSPAGQLADRIGRRLVVAPALLAAAAGLGLLGLAHTAGELLVAAALYGMGFGAGQPALMAMTADRVPVQERGRAMGTFYTAWELGISGGSVLLGLCATHLGYAATWWTGAAVAVLGAAGASRDITRHRG